MNTLENECKNIKWDDILDKAKLISLIPGVDWYNEGWTNDDELEYGILTILVDSCNGIHIPNCIYDMCNIRSLKDSPYDEWYHDIFNSFQQYANDSLNIWFDYPKHHLNIEYSEHGDLVVFVNREVA